MWVVLQGKGAQFYVPLSSVSGLVDEKSCLLLTLANLLTLFISFCVTERVEREWECGACKDRGAPPLWTVRPGSHF